LKYLVSPSHQLQGEITVPGDKSISHRAVMFSAIANGTSHIQGFLAGEDCLSTLNAFRQMGVEVEHLQDTELKVTGVGMHGLKPPANELDVGNSGTSIRLMAGLLCGQNFAVKLVGDQSLMKRPMRRVTDPLALMGAEIHTAENGVPPIQINPCQRLRGISYVMPVASAQVKSAILLAGLYAQGTTQVSESKVTRDHTERMLRTFSCEVLTKENIIQVKGGQSLTATDINVPADISSAAFFMVAACIAQQAEVVMHKVGINPTRVGVIDVLKRMGADIEITNETMFGNEPVATIIIRASSLQGIQIPESLVPSAIDEFPVICVAAACAQGVTKITGAEELRVKESDRIAQVANGLTALGIKVEEQPDGLTIYGGEMQAGIIESGGDHRIAMAFAVASLRAQGVIEIHDCANVATSFPNFVEAANQLGLAIDVVN
jgi:3-phosphoshikimate 1-carboxyvinyltransferase